MGGANNFTGTATVNAGTLALSGGSALADAVPVSLANVAGATLALNTSETLSSLAGGGTTGGNVTLGVNTLAVGDTASTTFAGVISDSGNGTLIKQGAGTLTLTGVNAPFTGKITINSGRTSIGGDANLGTASGAADQLTFNGGTRLSTAALTIGPARGIMLGANGGTFMLNVSTADITYGGNITGPRSLTKSLVSGVTSGNMNLSGVNTFSGGLTVTGGGMRLNSDTTAGTGTITLTPAGGATFTL